MEEYRLKNVTNKLKRLKVDFKTYDNTLVLKGTSLSGGQFFLSIVLPVVAFIVFLSSLFIYLLSVRPERIYPVLILIFLSLPLVLLFYGIKNLIRLRKSKKFQVQIIPGEIILRRKTEEIILPVELLRRMYITIEENKSNIAGEICVQSLDLKSFPLLNVIDSNSKYFKDDLEYIRDSFLMILGLPKKPEEESFVSPDPMEQSL